MQKTIIKTLFLALLSWTGSAFVAPTPATRTAVSLKALNDNAQWKAAAITAIVAVTQHPLVALAEEFTYGDDYEYGAVSAPNFVPIIGGILAIGTALLPIALQSGEEAFEEMKDSDGFGQGKDVLKSRRK
ncbi:expressed unknown protein [Seminavis robusta]|uniref:Uncharacterized protein n=1 Tax=Seminavis robusta TaxID=568900 RepID=A0A9N8E988_9STRA|nr:expressed unknown protein [Seminavis robusta]|eukprot:Sro796_g203750.1 n/a (130) ;mRNA; f:23250-23639